MKIEEAFKHKCNNCCSRLTPVTLVFNRHSFVKEYKAINPYDKRFIRLGWECPKCHRMPMQNSEIERHTKFMDGHECGRYDTRKLYLNKKAIRGEYRRFESQDTIVSKY